MESAPSRVFIIDPDEKESQMISDILSPSYDITVLNSAEYAYDIIRVNRPDLIIMNIDFPDYDGFELLAKFQSSTKTKNILIIVVTENESPEYEIRAYRHGVVGYFRRPLSPRLFSVQIHSFMTLVDRLTIMEHWATVDTLTEIANRRAFEYTIRVEWGRAQRNARPISLLVFDIDDFKSYNDKYGHSNGDIILQEMAKAISKCLSRSTDSVYRIGGEEFAILLPDTDEVYAANLAETVRAAIASHVIHLGGADIHLSITVSIGVSTVTPAYDADLQEFIHNVDLLMYKSKNEGKNRVSMNNEL